MLTPKDVLLLAVALFLLYISWAGRKYTYLKTPKGWKGPFKI